jgi:hypothetical protein
LSVSPSHHEGEENDREERTVRLNPIFFNFFFFLSNYIWCVSTQLG